jgi:hypothetical protein
MIRYDIIYTYTQICVPLNVKKLYSNCITYDGAKVRTFVCYVYSIYT